AAENLYLVQGGRVQVLYSDAKRGEIKQTYRPGDFFGFEMVPEEGVYQTTATAVGRCVLLYLDRDHLISLVEQIPELNLALKILHDSFFLRLRTAFSWTDENETLYFVARRHIVFLFGRMFPAALFAVISVPVLAWVSLFTSLKSTGLLLLVAAALISIAWLAWSYVDWSNDYSVITNQRILFQELVLLLYESRQEAPLTAILAVSTDTSQLGRWLGYGKVKIRTYAGMIILPDLAYPEYVAALVEAEWFRARNRRAEEEKDMIEDTLKTRLGYKTAKQAVVESVKPAEPEVEPGFLQRLFLNFLDIRFEKDGVITYRTHWIFLIRNILVPTCLMLGAVFFFVLRLWGYFKVLSVVSTAALVFLLLIVIGLWWLYQYVDWRNDFYVVSDEQVIDVYKKPLGREERRAAPLKNIQTVEFERNGLIGLIFNFGTVFIRVGDTDLTFDYVYNPSEIQQDIFRRIARREQNEREAVAREERKRLSDWLDIYHHVVQDHGNPENPTQG
ncbi:MAG: cyclic nucleotide-binding domain-containing protein, partial [Chloroflexi bacterium]|nr:cyclic nucleotide-binding domain-containing protein [Chloroflexota bacterium]